MDSSELLAVSTAMLSFSTFLGVLFALLYYLYLILKADIYQIILYAIIYIDVNLIFLYYLKRGGLLK